MKTEKVKMSQNSIGMLTSVVSQLNKTESQMDSIF